jgi:ATP-dependent DNA helicase RecG
MPDFKALVRSLLGPLELEASKGYPDAAVIGQSIGQYARGWGRRAKAALRLRSGQACQGDAERDLVGRIVKALAGYRQCDARRRRECVDRARELLRTLGADGGRPAGDGDRAGAEAPAQLERPAGRRTRPPPAETSAPAGRPGKMPSPSEWLSQPLAEGRLKSAGWVKRLASLGVETKRDLLYHFPRDYLPIKRIAELVDGERAAVVVAAGARQETPARERRAFRLMRYLLEVSDETGKAFLTSYAKVPRQGARAQAILGSPLTLNYQQGARLLVEGTVRRAGPLIEIQSGGSEKLSEGWAPPPGALAPVYPLTEGVFQGQVRPVVRRLLTALPPELPEPLPETLRQRHGLAGLREALLAIHWPRSAEEQAAAQRRLAFEELLILQVALAQRKKETQRPGSGISMPPRGDTVAALEEILPFSLTRAQQRAIAEIAADMAADRPMSRLVQGDVGSGKTVVAAAGLVIAIENGYQAALMAPTELLAEQHYLVLGKMLDPLGVEVELLSGSLPERDRKRAYQHIRDGRAQVVVGTQALIQQGVGFHRLGLVIVDEQHRFGVRQRAELWMKGHRPLPPAPGRPDMLVMTATPIPRSLALTLYGDLDLSVLDEMPPGRMPVKTRWLPLEQIGEAYQFVRQQVAAGRQVYVVCPLVEPSTALRPGESEALQAEAATRLAERLQREVFPDLEIGLLHGAMPVAEKDAAMESFRAGDKAILCATTVIEVGVDVPNATAMLILNAERFGLAQLHQLRGRIGRGGHQSHCLLLTDRKYHPLGRIAPAIEELSQARRRLQALLETTDGFTIAEQDLLLRGPGEFYGTRQHGLPDFRLARLTRDVTVMEEARAAAAWLIEQDPHLARPQHRALRQQVAAVRARMETAVG